MVAVSARTALPSCNQCPNGDGAIHRSVFVICVLKKVCIWSRNLVGSRFILHKLYPTNLVYHPPPGQRYADSLNGDITVRKVAENVQTTLGSVMSTIDYSLGEFKCKDLILASGLWCWWCVVGCESLANSWNLRRDLCHTNERFAIF